MPKCHGSLASPKVLDCQRRFHVSREQGEIWDGGWGMGDGGWGMGDVGWGMGMGDGQAS